MKTYKHRKTGEIATYKDGVLKSSGCCVEIGVEPSSKYWEEVIEKDYEIHSYLYGNMIVKNPKNCARPEECRINSVERLKDGKLFAVNNEIVYKDRVYTIEKIYLLSGSIMFYVGEGLNIHINNASVFQRPLFRTEDGKQIFEGETVYLVMTVGEMTYSKTTARKELKNPPSYYKYFSTEKAAQNYIKMNKPCLTYQEVLKLYDANTPFSCQGYFREKFKSGLTQTVKQKLK